MTPRILIAEDEPFILESLNFLLGREGYLLVAVQDGAEVLAAVERERPDLIVLDAMLPGQDGFGILGELRASSFGATTPVLVLTAKGQEADRKRMMALGADAFVTKPFANRDLLAEIAGLLDRGEAGAREANHGT
ncbi:response regulator transcription factor [Roseitalea porphyridii]|uniref:Response regulator n=1 Tax=Roseitalea porphyridii TaxID=1852022 RepID=A0A4P6V4S6_9HYPH|nr:response regulator [Roseitalea porphyridii]QBK31656.1 response regulator [Roseitalea porphyridii]